MARIVSICIVAALLLCAGILIAVVVAKEMQPLEVTFDGKLLTGGVAGLQLGPEPLLFGVNRDDVVARVYAAQELTYMVDGATCHIAEGTELTACFVVEQADGELQLQPVFVETLLQPLYPGSSIELVRDSVDWSKDLFHLTLTAPYSDAVTVGFYVSASLLAGVTLFPTEVVF